MKALLVLVVSIVISGCTTINNKIDYSNTRETKSADVPELADVVKENQLEIHRKTPGSDEAAIGVVLATSIGFATKDNFECKKECEQQLKDSISNRTKK